jgi:4-alpha-glucanotransferase
MNGVWRVGPGLELFTALQAQLGEVPILAEDLGIITTAVVPVRCGCVWGGNAGGGGLRF